MRAPRLNPQPEVQLAAGGIVWKKVEGGGRIVLVHRPKYGDWSLPKGKVDPGEDLPQTARREIDEEVGCPVEFLGFAGVVHYPIGPDRTKVVLFWHMLAGGAERFEPNAEVDRLLWVTPEDALKRLSYPVERELLQAALRALPEGVPGPQA